MFFAAMIDSKAARQSSSVLIVPVVRSWPVVWISPMALNTPFIAWHDGVSLRRVGDSRTKPTIFIRSTPCTAVSHCSRRSCAGSTLCTGCRRSVIYFSCTSGSGQRAGMNTGRVRRSSPKKALSRLPCWLLGNSELCDTVSSITTITPPTQ